MSMFGGIPVESSAPPSAGGSMFGGIPLDKPQPPQTDPGLGRTALDQSLQGASFGFADEATDALGALGARAVTAYKNNAPKLLGGDPGAYDGESLAGTMQDARAASKSRMQQEWQQHPVASIASNIAGGLATGKIMGATNAGEAIGSSIGSGGLPARIAKGAAAGAASGGLYGAGSADNGNRLEGAKQGAKYGAAFGAAAPALGAVASNVADGAKTAWKGIGARGTEALQEAASAQKQSGGELYNKMREVGALLNKDSTDSLVSSIDSAVSSKQFIPELNPKTLAIVNHIKKAAEGGELGLDELDQYRRLLGRVGGSEDGVSASAAKKAIDSVVNSLDNKGLVNGGEEAVSLLKQGRAQYHMASKFEDITDILAKADGDPNKIKSGLTRFVNNKDNIAGFTADEVEALKNAAKGTITEKLLKMGGKFGIDLGSSFTMGNTIGPVIGGAINPAIPVAGTAARQAQKYLARGKAEQLLNVIQNGGKAAQGTGAAPASAMPSMMGGQAGGKIGAPQAMPQGMSMPPTNLPDVQLPQLGLPPQVNAQPQSAPQQMGNALLDRISQAESGGNPNAQASTSSASGEYQFTDPTWKSMVAKHPEAGMTVGDKSNPNAQKKMAALLLQDNTQSLQSSLGRQPSDGELYIAHFLGAPKAAKLINHADDGVSAASMFPKAAAANKKIFYHNGQPLTTGQVYAKLLSKVEG